MNVLNHKLNYLKPALQVLTDTGISYQIIMGKKHPVIAFTHPTSGKEIKYTVPLTPSDYRGIKNCIADLKRMVVTAENPEKIGYSQFMKGGKGVVRIALSRATMLRMFGTDEITKQSRISVTINKPARQLIVEPSPNGHYSIFNANTVSNKMTAMVGCINIPCWKAQMPNCRRSSVRFDLDKWFANESVAIDLPEYLFQKPGWEAEEEIKKVEAKQAIENEKIDEENQKIDDAAQKLAAASGDCFDDHRAALQLLNDLLKDDIHLTALCDEDGKTISLVKHIQ